MITLSLKGLLVGILLIALIVLVIFLIVMVSKATDTLKGVNAIMEGGEKVVIAAVEEAQVKAAIIDEKTAPVRKLFGKAIDLVNGIINAIVK